MTVLADNIIFLVAGVQRLSHSGDTISISRNLTIASPSTFVSAVPLTFSTSNTSAQLIQTIQPSDLATNVLAVRAQDAYAGAVTNVVGGNLTLSSGLGTTGSNSGSVLVQTGGTTRLSVSPTNVAIPAITNAAYLKTDGSGNIGAGSSLAVSNLTGGTDGYILLTNGTTPTWTKFTGDVTNSDIGVTTVNSISGSSPIPITPANLQFTKSTVTPSLSQAAPTTDVATTSLTIQAQNAFASASTNLTGGNLTLQSGTGVGAHAYGGGSSTSLISMNIAGTTIMQLGNNANSTNGDSMTTPNLFTWNGLGIINIRSSGTMNFGTAGSPYSFGRTLSSTDLIFTPANASTFVFGNVATTSVAISQTALTSNTTSATGTNGVPFSITAQAGQADGYTTGGTITGGVGGALSIIAGVGGAASGATTNNGGAGGALNLSSGAGGVGTQTTGTAGNVNIQVGGTNIAVATPNQFQTTKGIQNNVTLTTLNTNYQILVTDYLIKVIANTATVTVTLPASPNKGDTYVIKDAGGTSSQFPITVNGNGNNIDGSSTYIMASNYAAMTLIYDATLKWSVI